MFKKFYHSIINYDQESGKLLQMIKKCSNLESKILDVGCGYGRNLNMLLNAGYQNVIGVEINVDIVKKNKERGLPCLCVNEFNKSEVTFDIILMSHIVEHFSPLELKNFIDSYLDKLNIGGNLFIITPLMSSYFYDDFDHVKPYQPAGIVSIFGGSGAQVQYYSRNKLVLKDLWFRRSYYRPILYRGLYIKSLNTRLFQVLLFTSALLFLISNKNFGKKDGWVGRFEKIS